jgi:hypothetical protein
MKTKEEILKAIGACARKLKRNPNNPRAKPYPRMNADGTDRKGHLSAETRIHGTPGQVRGENRISYLRAIFAC